MLPTIACIFHILFITVCHTTRTVHYQNNINSFLLCFGTTARNTQGDFPGIQTRTYCCFTCSYAVRLILIWIWIQIYCQHIFRRFRNTVHTAQITWHNTGKQECQQNQISHPLFVFREIIHIVSSFLLRFISRASLGTIHR